MIKKMVAVIFAVFMMLIIPMMPTVKSDDVPPDKPTCVSPIDNSIGISIHTKLKCHVYSSQNTALWVSFYWGNGTYICWTLVYNDSDAQSFNLNLQYNTTYSWYVNVSDAILQNTSDIFTFTTRITDFSPEKATCVFPSNNSINNSLDTKLKCHVIDNNNDSMTVTFYFNDTEINTWYDFGPISDVQNNSDVEIPYNLTHYTGMDYNLLCEWYVVANDSLSETASNIFRFTTKPYFPPSVACIFPLDNSTNIPINHTSLKVHVVSIDNLSMRVEFYSNNGNYLGARDSIRNNTDANTSELIGLPYKSTFQWYAIAYDGTGSIQTRNFTFTTEYQFMPSQPSSFTVTVTGQTTVNLSWVCGNKADSTEILRKTIGYSINQSDGVVVYNDVGSSCNDTNLTRATKYYYRAWSYNNTDGVWSISNCSANVTTNSPPWDINQDGTVNYLDVSLLVSHYGESGAPGWIPEDINSDGVVNYLDVSSLVSHYGEHY